MLCRDGGASQWVKCLPSVQEALGLTPRVRKLRCTWVEEQGGSEVQGHLCLCIELEVQPRMQERVCLTMSTCCLEVFF